MGEIVRINAGSKARGFEGVDKLRTQLSGGGTCLWVPSYGVRLGTKRVTENGTYSAADEQLYGYSSVEVNVNAEVDQLTGKGQDGNDYSITKNGSGGLVETKVPSSLVVTKYPNTIMYGTGAYLNFDGIEVTAYYGDGSSYGVIPFEELVFPITQAPWEPTEESGTATEGGTSVNFSMHGGSEEYQWNEDFKYETEITVLGRAYLVQVQTTEGGAYPTVYFSDTSTFVNANQIEYYNGHTMESRTISIDASTAARRTSPNGVRYYYKTFVYKMHVYVISSSLIPIGPVGLNEKNIGDILFDGNVVTEGGFQVPVQWVRPNDGKKLETSYNISVYSGPSGNDNNAAS